MNTSNVKNQKAGTILTVLIFLLLMLSIAPSGILANGIAIGPGLQINDEGAGYIRAPDQENEPNNDRTTAVANNNELKTAVDMEGQLKYQLDNVDYFYIDLSGGSGSIDRVNITPVFSDLAYLDDKAVGINLKVYSMYNGAPYLLEYKALGTKQAIINDSAIPWRTSTSLFFNADRTNRYYVNVSSTHIIDSNTNEVIDPDAIINYTLKIKVTSTSQTDNNNDPYNGTLLYGTLKGLNVTQSQDHWDWYKIDPMTKNRDVNLSVSVKIKKAIQTDITHYVKVIGVLWCYDLSTDTYKAYHAIGDWLGSYYPNEIDLFITATFNKAYLGIHSQQVLWIKNQESDTVDCGNSIVEYEIKSLEQKLQNNPPQLSNWNLTREIGNLEDDYSFQVDYQDSDDDEPLFVTITIGSTDYNMSRSTILSNDGDFSNGETYEITLSGTEFADIPHEHYKNLAFTFSAQDYFPELSMPLNLVSLDPKYYISVIDNTRPYLKSDLPENWTIPEDYGSYFIKLFNIFADPERKTNQAQEVTFEVWFDLYGWGSTTGSDNLTAEVLDNDTIKIETLPNQFGSDKILIRAYDVEGPLSAVKYELEIIIFPVNDKPVLAQPKDITDASEDKYVNITFQANDATDRYADTITFSTDILTKIPKLGAHPEKYRYQFSESSGTLSFLPDNALVGEYLINITATDSGIIEPIGLSTTKQFKLKILNENDKPVANITLPKENAKFNTSSIIILSAENSTDDDLIHGDSLEYLWYLDSTENLLIYRKQPVIEIDPIKESGKHILWLKVKDKSGTSSWDNVTIWIISLIDDYPGGEDTDDDGMPDIWEVAYDLDEKRPNANEDPDGDNYTNIQEFLGLDGKPGGGDSSDPNNQLSIPGDIDADQMSDKWERARFGSISQGKDDDPDGDGYTNYQEYLGADGIPDNDDWSDPLDINDIPIAKESNGPDNDDNSGTLLIVATIIVVIIIVLLILYLYIQKRKKKREEEEKEKSGEPKPFYTPEPMPSLSRMQPLPPVLPTQLPSYADIAGAQQPIPVTQPKVGATQVHAPQAPGQAPTTSQQLRPPPQTMGQIQISKSQTPSQTLPQSQPQTQPQTQPTSQTQPKTPSQAQPQMQLHPQPQTSSKQQSTLGLPPTGNISQNIEKKPVNK